MGNANLNRAVQLFALAHFVLGVSLAHAQSNPGALFDRAAELEAEGRWREAADSLLPLTETHARDYALFMRLGWLEYKAGRAAEAREHYRQAVEISGGAQEARLGLAWSLIDLGAHSEAGTLFEAILEESPELRSAHEGLAAARDARPSRIGQVSGGVSWVSHANHPDRDSGWGFTGSVEGVVDEGVALGLTFRFMQFEERLADFGGSGSGGPGPGPGGSSGSDGGSDASWNQEEIHLLGGLSRVNYGAYAHFSWLRDEGEFDDDLYVLGVSSWVGSDRPVSIEASVSFYPDGEVYRVSPAWRIPITHGLSVQPGAAIQLTADEQIEGTGFLVLIGDWDRGGIEIGAKLGRESRPAYLSIPVVLNLRDEIEWGAWSEASLRVGKSGRVSAGYALSRLRLEAGSSAKRSEMHVVSLNLGWMF